MNHDRRTVAAHERIIALLDRLGILYRTWEHRPVLNYGDAELARQEAGFDGVESKAIVCNTDRGLVVYLTTADQRMDQRAVKRLTGARSARLAAPETLMEQLGAVPGSAYPFGFAADIPIVVDPALYDLDKLLFSPALPTVTMQISGLDLRRILGAIGNDVLELPAKD
ncbi:MAG TPA: YbaK/EbsC family protein [Thermomicrobiales bacterium]|nr:YbaK/EbsC family protein [Thermomicrobiales bacterium]